MDIYTAFPSSYVKVDDLGGNPLKCVIDFVQLEEVGADKEEKAVAHFRDDAKPLILNRTNSDTIVDLYGRDTENWAGKMIVLVPDKTNYQGKRVPCIRIDERASKSDKPMTQAARAAVIDEAIPF